MFVAPPLAQQARAQAPASTTAAASAAPSKLDVAVEKRIAYLHTQMKITPDEEKAFDSFAAVMRANAARMDSVIQQQRSQPANGTAVDQLNAYAAMAQTHAQNMQQLSSAFATLYDSLTPQQKKLADQDFRHFRDEGRTTRS
jgi:hypothetical protein